VVIAMKKTDMELLADLIEIAERCFDGHLTIMKFTTNWRACFGTPMDDDDISNMPVGKYFFDAAIGAIGKAVTEGRITISARPAKKYDEANPPPIGDELPDCFK
jgi:hypothetical protein